MVQVHNLESAKLVVGTWDMLDSETGFPRTCLISLSDPGSTQLDLMLTKF